MYVCKVKPSVKIDSGLKCGKVTGSSLGGEDRRPDFWISVMTEWHKYWKAFCDSFRQKQGAQTQEGTTQNCKEMVSECIKITCTVDL